MSTIAKKICLMGDFGVGKTSLIRRFVDRQFSEQYLSTVGVRISRKLMTVAQTAAQAENSLQFLIWDIEGHTKLKAITPAYLQGASGGIIVGDLSRPETIEHISEHIQQFSALNPQSAIVVALNKSDLIAADKLPKLRQLEPFTERHPLATYITSARTGDAVDLMFETLSHYLMQRHELAV